jgi:hypothetical protein
MTDAVVVGSELDELAHTIETGHAAVQESLREGLLRAFEVGDALRRAREIVPPGAWTAWLAARGVRPVMSNLYVRLSFYRGEIEHEADTLAEARRLLVGLPPIPRRNAIPQALRQEVRRLNGDGFSVREISDRLGISRGQAQSCIDRARWSAIRRQQRVRRRKATAALRREENARLAREHGDALGDAYALVRRAEQRLDQVLSGRDRSSQIEHVHGYVRLAEESIGSALRYLHLAEDKLGVELRSGGAGSGT